MQALHLAIQFQQLDVSINLKGFLSSSTVANVSLAALKEKKKKKMDILVMNHPARFLVLVSIFSLLYNQEGIINLAVCKVGLITLYINHSAVILKWSDQHIFFRCNSYCDKSN